MWAKPTSGVLMPSGSALPTDLSMDVRSPVGSERSNSSSKSASSKRNRFLLKRQDCLEKLGFENELDLTITPTTLPNSPMITGTFLRIWSRDQKMEMEFC